MNTQIFNPWKKGWETINEGNELVPNLVSAVVVSTNFFETVGAVWRLVKPITRDRLWFTSTR